MLLVLEAPDGIAPEKYLNSMIGYHLTFENGLCAMAMTQGSQRKVINIGMGLKQLCVEPPGVTASAYAESFAHKVRSNPILYNIHIVMLGEFVTANTFGNVFHQWRPYGRTQDP
jgi:hypothetical protein